ncbi:MAG: AAA family ATPase [Pseudomonadota bacterium]
MAHLYIAYNPVDLDPLLDIHEALRQAGVPAWYPPSQSDASDMGLVASKIAGSFAMLVLVSASSLRDEHIHRSAEIARAQGIKIVPFQLDRARLVGPLKPLLATSLKHYLEDEDGQASLIEELRARYRARCPVMAVMNLKGGVGKTTITAQVIAALQAQASSRVLLIDLDPQYNLTQVFFDMEDADQRAERDASVISLFEKSSLHAPGTPSPAANWTALSREPFPLAPPEEWIHRILGDHGPPGRLDLISGQFEISKYAFATDADGLIAIKSSFLQQIETLRGQYDLIVFDTNPNATFLTQCALEAADRVLAPMHADTYSLRGVRLLNQVIQEQVNPAIAPKLSVLFNGVQRREQSSFEADARNGVFDQKAGFQLSHALLGTALPMSGHLRVKSPEEDVPAWRQLVIHHGKGGGLRPLREALETIALDVHRLNAAVVA